MQYLEAKLKREQKAYPTDWIIIPQPRSYNGQVDLIKIGTRPDVRLVEGTDCTIEELRELDYGMMP
jgi:hypothetical protein